MTKLSEITTPSLTYDEGAAPSTPAAGTVIIYAKADGLLYSKDDAGTETLVSGGSGGGSVATDAIWDAAGDLAVGSGANTAAKLAIGNAGAVLARINGAVAWNAGTAFPTAATGDRYFRTDRGIEYYYDGTRWLSMHTLNIPLTPEDNATWPPAATTLPVHRGSHPFSAYDLYLLTWEATSAVLTTNSGSAYWTASLRKYNSAGSDSVIATYDTSADTAGTAYAKSVAINALMGSYVAFYTDTAKTGSPGAHRFHGGTITCRLVG